MDKSTTIKAGDSLPEAHQWVAGVLRYERVRSQAKLTEEEIDSFIADLRDAAEVVNLPAEIPHVATDLCGGRAAMPVAAAITESDSVADTFIPIDCAPC